jgi:hypothetical protein
MQNMLIPHQIISSDSGMHVIIALTPNMRTSRETKRMTLTDFTPVQIDKETVA